MKIRVLLLASGDGSLVQAIIDAVKKDELDIQKKNPTLLYLPESLEAKKSLKDSRRSRD